MFGYVTVNKEELKVKDVKKYRAFYCGVCHELGKRHGTLSRITLTYDCTFIALLLTALYEEQVNENTSRCVVHPLKKHLYYHNRYIEYAADMNLLLCYYNLMDDWNDERKVISFSTAKMLKKEFQKICEKYPRQDRAVKNYMEQLTACERDKVKDIDYAAGLTGTLFAEIMIYEEDAWAGILRNIGFYLGKFIYLMDAYDDMEKDQKSGNYNPWLLMGDSEAIESFSEMILTMMLSECAKQFEKLPILEYVDILRNVLYSGIWTKYDRIRIKKKEQGV